MLFIAHVFFCVFIIFFEFSLCKITYNTYPDLIPARSTPYNPRVIDKTCLLKPDKGPCRANVLMYYFDPEKMECNKFYWGGCQGNGNRFDTRLDCKGTCLSKPNPGKVRPKWCSLRFDYGFCFGAVKRWYYDSLWKVCKETIYSGCGGNKNNFNDLFECEAFCLYGVPQLRTTTPSYGMLNKVVIIDPEQATKKKSKIQITTRTTSSTEPNTRVTLGVPYPKGKTEPYY